MNAPVNFEIAKLLKEKGCNMNTIFVYKTENNTTSVLIPSGLNAMGGFFSTYPAPTIAEVVMWLYEKHGIWINSEPRNKTQWKYNIYTKQTASVKNIMLAEHNSPTEAYSAAILYTLNNLI